MLSGISYQMSFICNLHVECQSYYRSLCNVDASSYGNVVESESSDKRTRTKHCDQNYESGPGAVFTTLYIFRNLQIDSVN